MLYCVNVENCKSCPAAYGVFKIIEVNLKCSPNLKRYRYFGYLLAIRMIENILFKYFLKVVAIFTSGNQLWSAFSHMERWRLLWERELRYFSNWRFSYSKMNGRRQKIWRSPMLVLKFREDLVHIWSQFYVCLLAPAMGLEW